MNRIVTFVLFAVTIGGLAYTVCEFIAIRVLRGQTMEITQSTTALRARDAQLAAQETETLQRIEAIERDNATLAMAIEQAAAARRAAAALSPEEVSQRIRAAQLAIARGGDKSEALDSLLACYDRGLSQLVGTARQRQLSMIVIALGQLTSSYPAAADALRQRFATAKDRLLAGDDTIAADVALLAKALHDNAALLTVYDALGEKAPGKNTLAIYGFDALLDARRYTDALRGQPASRLLAQFDLVTNPPVAQVPAANREMLEKLQRKSAIDRITKQIEVLAGVGDLENARILSQKLLAYDSSEGTKATLQSHLDRAGQGNLLH